MSYFTALLVPGGRSWSSRDADLMEVDSLEELVDTVREQVDGGTGLVVLEREDEWFALVRVDGDDDARVFVSDLPAARASTFSGVFADPDVWSDAGSLRAAGLVPDDDGFGGGYDEDEPAAPVSEEDAPKVTEVPWAGDLSVLEDMGIGGEALKQVVEDDADDPARALTEIGERVGFLDLLETLR
ncbi:tRNA adenosine deaminase-associated protein [Aquipuribacter nitratireducens]|uniref:tRNA adenosine deaminase-associated protein n=1 Tax=Aquipuribacter nitratireducens TaxID=650104 RepID=A0ABW0GQJ2_9MICO